jgi:hypothetical protein
VTIISAVIGATALYFYQEWNLTALRDLSVFFLVFFVVALAVELVYIIAIRKGFKRFLYEERIKTKIEQNLIAIGACYKSETSNFYCLPRIKLDFENSIVVLQLEDVKIRKQIEAYKDQLSTALPDALTVKDYYISNTGNQFIIRFKDEANDKQRIYKSLGEYLKHIDYNDQLIMEADEEHRISLLDYSHWAILGSTGSGKSYLAQLLLIQFVRKCFDVRIYDVKKSYAAFSDIVEDYETEPERIIKNLKQVAEEMRERQNNLADIMKTDPRALAVQYGYRPIVVFIEEYIGLKTLLDKEQTKTLENTIKEISVLARSVNISLLIVAQSSSVDIIDSAIKNNLNKIFLGHLASNISVSTFGTGVEVPLFSQIEKGYGYIQLDKVEQIKVPRVLFSVEELEQLTK